MSWARLTYILHYARPLVWFSLLLKVVKWFFNPQFLTFEFINFDDNVYVYDNPQVRQGLSWLGFRWAFTTMQAGHWHPLTWLSHMLDVNFFGLDPAGHHASNLFLHTCSVALVYLLLKRVVVIVIPKNPHVK